MVIGRKIPDDVTFNIPGLINPSFIPLDVWQYEKVKPRFHTNKNSYRNDIFQGREIEYDPQLTCMYD